jgi:hypothetical protein
MGEYQARLQFRILEINSLIQISLRLFTSFFTAQQLLQQLLYNGHYNLQKTTEPSRTGTTGLSCNTITGSGNSIPRSLCPRDRLIDNHINDIIINTYLDSLG